MLQFCEYPFIFDATSKTLLLQADANCQMQVQFCIDLVFFSIQQVLTMSIQIHRFTNLMID